MCKKLRSLFLVFLLAVLAIGTAQLPTFQTGSIPVKAAGMNLPVMLMLMRLANKKDNDDMNKVSLSRKGKIVYYLTCATFCAIGIAFILMIFFDFDLLFLVESLFIVLIVLLAILFIFF